MIATDPPPARPRWANAATVGVALGLVAGMVALMAGLGYQRGWWGLRTGILAVSVSGIAATCVLLGTVSGALLALRQRLRRTTMLFLGGAAVAAMTAVPLATFGYKAKTLPAIHDISTDLRNPPRFEAVLPLRREARNSVDYDPAVAALQLQAYPDIAPISVQRPGTEVLVLAQQVGLGMGWEMVAADAAALRLEATASTRLFGFRDDIVVRISPAGAGCIVDVRSLSRVGVSDLGANAGRIRAFRTRLLEAVGQP